MRLNQNAEAIPLCQHLRAIQDIFPYQKFHQTGWKCEWQMSKWLSEEWSFFLSSSSRNSILPPLHFLTRFINLSLKIHFEFVRRKITQYQKWFKVSQNASKMPHNVSIFKEFNGIWPFHFCQATRITRKWQKTIFSSINSESAINLQEFWINHFVLRLYFVRIVKCCEKFLNEFICGEWWESPQQLRKWLIHTEFGSWINLLVSFWMYVCLFSGAEGNMFNSFK